MRVISLPFDQVKEEMVCFDHARKLTEVLTGNNAECEYSQALIHITSTRGNEGWTIAN